MKPIFLFIASLLGLAPLLAQNIQPDWSGTFGGNGSETLSRVRQASNGYVLAVGETTSQTRGGKDGYLLIADYSTGRIIRELRFGGPKDDAFYDVAQTPEGHFILAGYTESVAKNGREAWLVHIDESGKTLGEYTFGSPGRDEIRSLAIDGAGLLYFAGYKNAQAEGDLWIGSWAKGAVQSETEVGSGAYGTLANMVLSASGGLLLCGNTRKTGDVYLLKTSQSGQVQWSKTFGGKDWEEALDLIQTRDGGIAIAGLTRSKGAGDLDAWLIRTSRDGALLWDRTYGESGMDMANTLVQTEDGGFLLAGASRSYRSGARKSKAFVVKTGPGGDLQWRDYYGGGNDEQALHAAMLFNGSMLIAGNAPSSSGASRAWLFRLSDPNRREVLMRDVPQLEVAAPKLVSADQTSVKPSENAYLSLRIANRSGLDLSDVRIEAEAQGSAQVEVWSTVYTGLVPDREERWVHIPVRGRPDLRDGQTPVAIKIFSGAKSLYEGSAQVATHLPVAADLQIADFQFAPSTRSDEVALVVQVGNAGDFNSKTAEVFFECPPGIRPIGSVQMPLGILEARGRREVRFPFVKTSEYRDALVRIVCVVREGGQEKVRKTLEWRSVPGQAITSSGPIMIWTDPAPHELGTNKVRRNDKDFEFKMTVVSSKPLTSQNFKLRVNGVELDGSKFNEQELSAPKRENQKFTYSYRNKVPLGQGENKLEVLIDGEQSEPLFVEFAPERANLHIVAIGPQHSDLRYTSKDAQDFARAFQAQGGSNQLYQQVIVHELATPERTSLTRIKQMMYDLNYQWRDGQIKPNDVLIVFISSHGKIAANRFRILQTDYDPRYEDLSVDFKRDILDILSGIQCKKLVMLDACHSGGAKDGFGALSNAIIDLARTQPGVSTLSSCRSDEKSYESPVWQNGAFTAALLEAFANKPGMDAGGAFFADADRDGVLRLGELYDYIQRRVPQMVKKEIPNAPTTQVPFMPENQLDRNMPLLLLQNQ